MKYVVSSPSRTGSTLLCNILKSAGQTEVMQTHNCFFSVDEPESTVVLFSLRRDLFRSIMSCLIGKRTKIYNLYDDISVPTIEPFVLDCTDYESEFQRQYRWHKWYVQSHDISKPYRQIETFYLEDFVNNYELVYKKLMLTKQQEVMVPKESKYLYQDLVLNHQQCKEIFDKLELTSEFTPILKPYNPALPN